MKVKELKGKRTVKGMPTKVLPINELMEAEYNPRRISDAELARLKHSMDTLGYLQPIVWNASTRRVVGGHQRLKVLKASGVEAVEVVVVEWGEDREKWANVALNKIGGEWDEGMLLELLSSMDSEDLEASGFTESELDELAVEVALAGEGLGGGGSEDEGAPTNGLGTPVISHTLVFEDVEQQRVWHSFLRYLRGTSEDGQVLSARLVEWLRERSESWGGE